MMPMMAVIHLNLPARQLPSGGKGNRREGGGEKLQFWNTTVLFLEQVGCLGFLEIPWR